jgi:hypothetical protein
MIGDGEVKVMIRHHRNDGGAPIAFCTATSDPDGLFNVSNATDRPVHIQGLRDGVLYTFNATCTNTAGFTSPPSRPSRKVMPRKGLKPLKPDHPRCGAPSAPQLRRVRPGDELVSVFFRPSLHDGCCTVSNYTVIAHPGGYRSVVTSPVDGVVVHNLTNGLVYTFQMFATNACGRRSRMTGMSAHVKPRFPRVIVTVSGMLRVRDCVLYDLELMADAVLHKLDTNGVPGLQGSEYAREPDLIKRVVAALIERCKPEVAGEPDPYPEVANGDHKVGTQDLVIALRDWVTAMLRPEFGCMGPYCGAMARASKAPPLQRLLYGAAVKPISFPPLARNLSSDEIKKLRTVSRDRVLPCI